MKPLGPGAVPVVESGGRRLGVPQPFPRRPRLQATFAPDSIAVIGASETPGSMGRALMENLAAFRGLVYPVNPHRKMVLGTEAFPTMGAIPASIDLAVIATPCSGLRIPNVRARHSSGREHARGWRAGQRDGDRHPVW